MAKSKKTKIHKKIDGQLLQMNKKFTDLKIKQKDKITGWVYEEYKKYVTEHDKAPDSLADEQIVEAVLDKINEAQNMKVFAYSGSQGKIKELIRDFISENFN